MDDIIDVITDLIIVLLFVSLCWIGLEYLIEGSVKYSDVDGIIAIVLSVSLTSNVLSWRNNYES